MIYESDQDRQNQEQFKQLLGNLGTVIETHTLAPFDFILQRKNGKTVSIWEYKKRKYRLSDFEDFFESVNKINSCIEIAEAMKAPFIYAIQYLDSLVYMEITREKLGEPRPGGRLDRGRDADIKPCYYFKTKDLRIFN